MNRPLSRAALAAVAILTSMTGLLFEQIFVRNLAVVGGEVLFAQTLTLIFYLAGLGAGSYGADRIGEAKAARFLPRFGFLLALAGFLSVPGGQILYFIFKFFLHDYGGDILLSVMRTKRGVLWAAQIFPVIFGALSGFEVSVLVRMGGAIDSKRGASLVLGANYLGAVLASVIFVAWLAALPPFLAAAAVAVFATMIYVGLAWRLALPEGRRGARAMIAGGALMLFYVFLMPFDPAFEQFALKSRYASGLRLFTWRIVPSFLRDDLLARADGVRLYTRYQVADFMPLTRKGITFFLDGHPQLDPAWSGAYHEALIHAPVQFFKQIPKRVLILGGGDGIAAAEILRYQDVESVRLVELDPEILRLARELDYFTDQNRNVFADPRLRVTAGDAIEFLRTSREKFDWIVADFPLPFDYDLLKLFSVEFYALVRQHLTADGTFVFDSGMRRANWPGGDHREWNGILAATLRASGFENFRPYSGNEIFIVARRDSKKPQTEWTDLGVRAPTIDRAFMKSTFDVQIETNEEGINSIFKPHLHKLESVDF